MMTMMMEQNLAETMMTLEVGVALEVVMTIVTLEEPGVALGIGLPVVK